MYFNIPPIAYAFVIFSLMTIGSLSEIIGSAILTVDKGKLEQLSSHWINEQSSLHSDCFFLQALRSALPNLCNFIINLVKGTSVWFLS